MSRTFLTIIYFTSLIFTSSTTISVKVINVTKVNSDLEKVSLQITESLSISEVKAKVLPVVDVKCSEAVDHVVPFYNLTVDPETGLAELIVSHGDSICLQIYDQNQDNAIFSEIVNLENNR